MAEIAWEVSNFITPERNVENPHRLTPAWGFRLTPRRRHVAPLPCRGWHGVGHGRASGAPLQPPGGNEDKFWGSISTRRDAAGLGVNGREVSPSERSWLFPDPSFSRRPAMEEVENVLYRLPKTTFLLADKSTVNKRDQYGNAAPLHTDIWGLF